MLGVLERRWGLPLLRPVALIVALSLLVLSSGRTPVVAQGQPSPLSSTDQVALRQKFIETR